MPTPYSLNVSTFRSYAMVDNFGWQGILHPSQWVGCYRNLSYEVSHIGNVSGLYSIARLLQYYSVPLSGQYEMTGVVRLHD
jgi:hypothetical protein